MPYANLTLSHPMDSVCDDWNAPSYKNQKRILLTLTSVLYSVTVIISAFRLCARRKTVAQPPPSGQWYAAGLYDLRQPQTLPKAERDAATKHVAPYTILYERTYPSGAYAWRYTLDGVTWLYPSRTAVIRRGRTTEGDMLHSHTD